MASSSTKRKARKDPGGKGSAKKLQTEDDSEDYIVFPYVVLRKIFFNFLAKDLGNVAMVCRLWREVATYELKRRKPVVRLTSYDTSFENCDVDTHFHNTLINKPMLAMFFNSAECEPRGCLKSHLPQSCVSVSLFNSGIVMNAEIENAENTVAYTFLPEHPDVHINYIVATTSGLTQFNKKTEITELFDYPRHKRLKEAEIMINSTFKRVKDVKCMILLRSEKFTEDRKLCGLKTFKEYVKVAWGGVSERLFIHRAGKQEMEEIHWLAMMISGPTVKAWSMVARQDWGIEPVEQKMLEMKEKLDLQKHTVGFMFSCIGRGSGWYDNEGNVEANLWKKIFPDIPLIGSFGNGEYGVNSDDTNPFNMYHRYSSTFMILTYG